MQLELLTNGTFCIYGAGIVATSIYTAIKTLYHRKPLFFIVSDAPEGKCDENPTEIEGIAVKRLSEWKKDLQTFHEGKSKNSDEQDEAFGIEGSSGNILLPDNYLIVTPEIHQPAIAASLRSLGIEDSDIILFTNELENVFMEAYYSSLPDCTTVAGVLSKASLQTGKAAPQSGDIGLAEEIQKADRIQVFQAKCHVDKLLQKPVENPAYVYPLQVGADLTDEVITRLRDNEGENISGKNRNYCELTASYYAWKNSHAAYKGLCHYRRIFDISEEQMQKLLEMRDEWDVILPYPSIHYPNISIQHTRYIKDSDWRAMLKALEETAPAYLEAYEKYVRDGEQFFYNYNMLIAKTEIFDDYCRFMFRVLERTEELTMPKGADRADRFAGYMGENLTTIYFLKNRYRLKIVYAGKMWFT